MGFWSKIFTWWNGATVGTALWTRLNGDEVGRDDAGNLYYASKGDRPKRWVIYNGNNDGNNTIKIPGVRGNGGPQPQNPGNT